MIKIYTAAVLALLFALPGCNDDKKAEVEKPVVCYDVINRTLLINRCTGETWLWLSDPVLDADGKSTDTVWGWYEVRRIHAENAVRSSK